jgi:starch phosphorylase
MPSSKRKPTRAAKAAAVTASLETVAPAAVSAANVEALKQAILDHLKFTQARDQGTASNRDWWISTCLAVRDRLLERMIRTQGVHNNGNMRRMYYLSLEYLMGRLLQNNLYAAGIYEETQAALRAIGKDPDLVLDEEHDMGLGNGGLGRLAACFLDSLATLDLPAIGYGIHYEFGLFRQEFVNGHQVEHPDAWMGRGAPWEIERPEYTETVQLYGHVETRFDNLGRAYQRWVNTKPMLGVPHDIPIAGYGTATVNFLRLWESRASQDFDLAAFNKGGYVEAVRDKAIGETVSKVLYPNDKTESGKELRLVQQYFFVACSLRDIIRRYRKANEGWENFPAKVAIQLNDTHPAIAVLELMRILIDEEGMAYDQAWGIVGRVFAYTNHTLLPEALERWSVPLLRKVVPRHLQIAFDINQRLMDTVEARWPGDNEKKRVCSIVEEGHVQSIRMAHLSVVASHSVNGVAALHTELLKKDLFPEFDALFPGRFNNKTNGITPRRWLRSCNPRLSALIDSKIGTGWTRDLDQLRKLEQWADDPQFQADFMAAKRANKEDLAKVIRHLCDVEVSPDALFDVQVKRLHEYKRQHLNLLHILALYRRLLQNPKLDIAPRVFVFGAKAAPGYDLAKNIIKAANSMAKTINADERIGGKLKIAFLPNYGVSLAEKIIPAADLSEQISTAGKEASGTGNMKLALNGACTIGTLDGANVEIREEVGDENIFIFGLTVEEVEALQAKGYNPWEYFHKSEELRAVLEWLGSGYFTPEDPHCLGGLRYSLLDGGDPFLVLADYESYCAAHDRVDVAFKDKARWAKMAILNTARVGKFSSDRTIAEYNRDIWHLAPAPVP